MNPRDKPEDQSLEHHYFEVLAAMHRALPEPQWHRSQTELREAFEYHRRRGISNVEAWAKVEIEAYSALQRQTRVRETIVFGTKVATAVVAAATSGYFAGHIDN